MEVSRETFKKADNSTQNLILFDSINDIVDSLKEKHAIHDDMHFKLNGAIRKSGKINRATSAGSGLLGGFLAVIASKIFGIS